MPMLVKVLISALAVVLAAYLLPGVRVDSVFVALVVAVVLGLINFFVRPLFVILTLPITVFTLGLFLLVINALMVMLVAAVVPGFAVDGFWWALLFSLVVSVVSAFLNRKA
ncbi:MAG: phage holin family protein [Patescibacteria group bacterium]|nr:phage holin family protein [Patescibacteria group bacterium]